jgi:hypothetical protein
MVRLSRGLKLELDAYRSTVEIASNRMDEVRSERRSLASRLASEVLTLVAQEGWVTPGMVRQVLTERDRTEG